MTADWHELMIPRRIMRPSIAGASEQLDTWCSMQTHHRNLQRYRAVSLQQHAFPVLSYALCV